MVQANAGHSTSLPNSPSLNAVFVEAGRQLLNIRAHHIVGEPDRHDAEELVANLRGLAAVIDPVVAAIGRYDSAAIFNARLIILRLASSDRPIEGRARPTAAMPPIGRPGFRTTCPETPCCIN
jgi:hypothetical protein